MTDLTDLETDRLDSTRFERTSGCQFEQLRDFRSCSQADRKRPSWDRSSEGRRDDEQVGPEFEIDSGVVAVGSGFGTGPGNLAWLAAVDPASQAKIKPHSCPFPYRNWILVSREGVVSLHLAACVRVCFPFIFLLSAVWPRVASLSCRYERSARQTFRPTLGTANTSHGHF